MKKLLSILICVICASHMLYSDNVSHTVYVEVCGNTGGTVAVQGTTRGGALQGYQQSWLTKTNYSSTNISTQTYSSNGVTGYGSYDTKFKIFASILDSDNYYFKGWYTSCAATDLVSDALEYAITKPHNNTKQTYRYYAIFKHYVWGTENRTAEAVPTAWGEVSLDNSNWGPTASKTDGTPIKIKQEETISLTYYARTIGENTFFLGWYDGTDIATAKLLSEEPTYTHNYTPSSQE